MATNKRGNDALNDNPDSNPDAITGAPGSHPIGTGVGAAGGGAAGAAIGAAVSGPAAPVGAVVGAVIGAVAGGLAGKGAAEAVNPTNEDAFWRENYRNRPYYESGYTYEEDYRPAYEYGWRTYPAASGKSFEEVEPDLQGGWETTKAKSRLGWDKAKFAARDAWDRLESGGEDVTPEKMGGNLGTSQAYPGRGETRGFEGDTLNVRDEDFDKFASTYRGRYSGRSFDDVESDLRRDWDSTHSGSKTWENVKDSVRRAWHKVERAMPGDADRDGR